MNVSMVNIGLQDGIVRETVRGGVNKVIDGSPFILKEI